MLAPVVVKAQKNVVDPTRVKQLVAQNAAAIGIAQNNLENFRVLSAYYDKTSGAIVAHLQQTWLGVDILNAISAVTFKNDKLAVSNFYPFDEAPIVALNKQNVPSISAASAVQKAATEIGLYPQGSLVAISRSSDGLQQNFGKLGIALSDITANLNWVPTEAGNEYKLAWQVSLNPSEGSAGWMINIDALKGNTISKNNITIYEKANTTTLRNKGKRVYIFSDDNHGDNPKVELNNNPEGLAAVSTAKYNVIPYPVESPLIGSPKLVVDPWNLSTDPKAITNKWNTDGIKDYDSTKGNNARTADDFKGDDDKTIGYTPKSSTALPNLTFNFPPDFTQDPLSDIFTESFGLTNLFYWNNIMHDLTYHYGFDEVAGNYQQTNFGRGGKEGDYISSTNYDNSCNKNIFGQCTDTSILNADFLPTVDGSVGRMQIYNFLASALKTTYANAPADFVGFKVSREGTVSTNNKLTQLGIQTSDVVIWKDALHPDSSTACGSAANVAELSGKFALIERGSCSFVQKYKSAQTAGAKGIIVYNVAENDPRYAAATYAGQKGNVILRMGGSDNTITIPGVFVGRDTALKMISYIKNSQAVNCSLYPSPAIDAALDNTISPHEYAHGISNRLAGGPQTVSCLNNGEQMGEGISDYYALMATTDWANVDVTDGGKRRPIGNYAFGLDTTYDGIRDYPVVVSLGDTVDYAIPYSTNFDYNPYTYDSLKKGGFPEYTASNGTIYYTGTFWATALWEVTWQLVNDYGISANLFDPNGTGGNVISMKLVTQGLKLQKCSPGCVDARDGILKADTLLFGGKYSASLWKAFARRGLGLSANQGLNTKIKDAVGAYDVPTLPVKWGSFTATKQGSSALLKWTTASENNADKFIVERSTDGRTFTQVGNAVKANNNSNGGTYSIVDNKPFNGNNIYRIKQIDFDGKFDYSDIRSLNFADLRPLITLAPNPAKDFVNVKVEGNTETLTIQIVSAGGQVIGTYTMNGEGTTINIASLAHGVYGLVINGKGYSAKYKLMVQ